MKELCDSSQVVCSVCVVHRSWTGCSADDRAIFLPSVFIHSNCDCHREEKVTAAFFAVYTKVRW
jgi:hypothetical protein